jgi:hypothetical protein
VLVMDSIFVIPWLLAVSLLKSVSFTNKKTYGPLFDNLIIGVFESNLRRRLRSSSNLVGRVGEVMKNGVPGGVHAHKRPRQLYDGRKIGSY